MLGMANFVRRMAETKLFYVRIRSKNDVKTTFCEPLNRRTLSHWPETRPLMLNIDVSFLLKLKAVWNCNRRELKIGKTEDTVTDL